MKKTGVVHLGNSKLISLVRENLIIVIFSLIFVLGVLAGALIISGGFLRNEAENLLSAFIKVHIYSGFFKLFLSNFFISFVFLFLVYLFGTSLLGLAFVPFIVFTKGAISGLLLCGLYSSYGLTGIAMNLLTVLPGTLICTLALISGAGHSLNLSYSLGKMILSEGQSLYKIDIARFLKSFCLLLFVTAIGTLFETFLFSVFQKFFALG